MELIPLARFKSEALQSLFQEEKEEWAKNLRWDYSEPLQIICNLMDGLFLSGFVALKHGMPAGYVFYLEEDCNGLIGDCFVSGGSSGLGVEEALMNVTVETLKANPKIDRIESQFVSFRSWPCEGFFHKHGFSCYERYFMMRDCEKPTGLAVSGDIELKYWDVSNLETASRLTAQAYDEIIDREISFHYQSPRGCRNFLAGIIEKPGCGRFMNDASFCAWHRPTGEMVGFILTSGVSPLNGHIPQVLVSRRFQGTGIGRSLLNQAIAALKSKRYRTVSLSVTAENKPAYELYRRFQFDILIRFQTSVWKRQTVGRRIA
jgi:ribosomal protein S18 acetylase RimI-like enzyme